MLRKCSRNDLKRPEIQIFPGVFPHSFLVCALHLHLWAAGNPLANFCLRPCTHTQHTHTHTHTHKHIYTKNIDNAHTHKYTHKHTHMHTHKHTHTHTQAAHTRFNLVACNRYLPLRCLVYGSKRGHTYVLVFTITEPLALKDLLSSLKTYVSSPPSPSLHLESDDQSVSFSCFSHTFVHSCSIRNFRKVGLKQQHLEL